MFYRCLRVTVAQLLPHGCDFFCLFLYTLGGVPLTGEASEFSVIHALYSIFFILLWLFTSGCYFREHAWAVADVGCVYFFQF